MSETEDLRRFIREILLRFDALAREMRDENRIAREENRAYFERIDRKLDEQLEESRAQRAALFRILDRLDGGGTAPA